MEYIIMRELNSNDIKHVNGGIGILVEFLSIKMIEWYNS